MNETQTRGPTPTDLGARAAHRPASTGWPRWVPYAAALWSLAYGVMALWWTWTGDGFPFGTNDPESMSVVRWLTPDIGAPLFAAVALGGAGLAALMARAPWPALAALPWLRGAVLGAGTAMAVALLVAVPDTRVLALVGYLPMVVFVAPFDAEMRERLDGAFDLIYAYQAAALVGGFLWALATLAFARRTADGCDRCGRGEASRRWTSPASAARWGRRVTYVAVIVPALYAVTRFAWALGIPLGISSEFQAEGEVEGAWLAATWLGGFAVVGSVLTLGLVQRWGEVFPRWVPGLRGRMVPVGLAVVPASLVAVLAFDGGVGMYVAAVEDGALAMTADSWGAVGPTLLWPLWGVALGLATLAYYLRRRGRCERCGRE